MGSSCWCLARCCINSSRVHQRRLVMTSGGDEAHVRVRVRIGVLGIRDACMGWCRALAVFFNC